MRLLDSRRLTGPSVMHSAPAVIVEVACEDPRAAIGVWEGELSRMGAALGLRFETFTRAHEGGAALAFAAPIDVLLPMTDVNEWAVFSAAEILAGRVALPLEPRRTEMAEALATARDPRLVEIARESPVPLLLDDDALTLGMGRTARTWPRSELPASIDYASLRAVPIGLVTGTNGKTTSTRLVARIAREAGRVCGSTSTDGITVDGARVQDGDWTGPAGALAVLRRPEVEIAVLETARGGILRRGLAVTACDAALITNVSSDHLGDYGIDDVDAMARVKAVVLSVARTAVLNAEDPRLLQISHPNVVWFAIDRPLGEQAWFVDDGFITHSARGKILRVDEVPITFGGKARYNIENALGAAALASALGLPDDAIAAGLRAFTSSVSDNPGRGNLSRLPSGTRVLVDFGHNPAGLARVLAFARAIAGDGPVTVIHGMPGDRLDDEIREAARAIARARPRRVVLRDLDGYLRGREPGEVPALIEQELGACLRATGEVEALELALVDAAPDELIAILPSIAGPAVHAFLHARGAV